VVANPVKERTRIRGSADIVANSFIFPPVI